MCGILGSINLPFDENILRLISHRGPDDMGIICKTIGRNIVTLGHTRLSIVDLSPAGHQPMCTDDGNYSIAFNGEIYNHSDLRGQLRQTGFKGHSDTETILHYLSEKGIWGANDFSGIFAFAFQDSRQKKLFLARDQFGTKPLYYAKKVNSFVFSSEIKPILELIDDSLDLENLAQLLRLRYSPAPDTLFKNIKKVRPGHIIKIDLAKPGMDIREFFYAKLPNSTASSLKFKDVKAIYGSLLEKSIKSQLMSDVEVGILLSGGIDSGLIAALAQKHTPYRLKGFTIGFDEESYADEINDAKKTAEFIGMECITSRVSFDDFLSTVKMSTIIVEEPLATTSVVPMYFLSALASSHVKVVLSGQGADEYLGGYKRYQGELYRQFAPFIPSAAISAASFLSKIIGVRSDIVERGLKAFGETNDLTRFLLVYEVFTDTEIEALIGQPDRKAIEKIGYFYDLLNCSDQKHSVNKMMMLDLNMSLSDDLLLYTDKITMHYGLECRVPMLDLELVQFVQSLPYDFRLKLGDSKLIHKSFAESVLPQSIVHRKKKGFLSPTNKWLNQTKKLSDVLLNPNSKFATIFDLRAVKKSIQEQGMGFNRERHIFLLLSLYYWFETFL